MGTSAFTQDSIAMMRSALVLLALCSVCAAKTTCSDSGYTVYADMHDGDFKYATLQDGMIKLRPYNNSETWTVEAKWDTVHCNTSIDFNVAGKPNPPPVPLTATLFKGEGGEGQAPLLTVVFTDPTGTLAHPTMPLNSWIGIESGPVPPPTPPAPPSSTPTCAKAGQSALCKLACRSTCRGFHPGFKSPGCVDQSDCTAPPPWAAKSVCTC